MLDKCVWEPNKEEDLIPATTIIPSMIFMKEKYTPDGKFDKLKARIVDIASPTASIVSVFTVAAEEGRQGRSSLETFLEHTYMQQSKKIFIWLSIKKSVKS